MIKEDFYTKNIDNTETVMLVDFMNLSMRNLFIVPYDPLDEQFLTWKSMMFRSLVKMLREKHPDKMIICLEGGSNWRKEYYTEYKANRVVNRMNSKYDFDKFFPVFDNFIEQLKVLLPNVAFIKVPRAEADDVIAVITQTLTDKRILNVSTDRDFYQLLKYKNYHQYDPIKKTDISVLNPVNYLLEKVIVGDSGDNVPPVKKGIGPKTAEKIINSEEGIDEWMKAHELTKEFERNLNLISFDFIPMDVKQAITKVLNEYINDEYHSNVLFNFMQKNGMGGFIDSINEYDSLFKAIKPFNFMTENELANL